MAFIDFEGEVCLSLTVTQIGGGSSSGYYTYISLPSLFVSLALTPIYILIDYIVIFFLHCAKKKKQSKQTTFYHNFICCSRGQLSLSSIRINRFWQVKIKNKCISKENKAKQAGCFFSFIKTQLDYHTVLFYFIFYCYLVRVRHDCYIKEEIVKVFS